MSRSCGRLKEGKRCVTCVCVCMFVCVCASNLCVFVFVLFACLCMSGFSTIEAVKRIYMYTMAMHT